MRVVCGASVSWDLNIAATTLFFFYQVVWSPCSRFIAVHSRSNSQAVDILDPATFQRLQTLEFPSTGHACPIAFCFSPDSRVLTCSNGGSMGCVLSGHRNRDVVVWDLQTGGIIVSANLWIEHYQFVRTSADFPPMGSITYSMDGKMVGVLHRGSGHTTISIYDLASGVHIHTHSPHILSGSGLYGTVSDDIWTHGESLRFVTIAPTAITIWEVGFTSGIMAMKVETISIPYSILTTKPETGFRKVWFHPTLSQLIVANMGEFLVWDTQNSKPLLYCTDIQYHPRISVSSNGSFLTCQTTGLEIRLWKKSPTGYTIQGAFMSSNDSCPLLSPNGESIVVLEGHLLRLWQIKSFTTIPSSPLAQGPRNTRDFIIDFSLDRMLTVFVRLEDDTVTVLDLKSGVPKLTINTSMKVYGLKLTRNTVIVIGSKKIITWILPSGDCAPGMVGIKDSAQIVNFSSKQNSMLAASISPDLCHVVIAFNSRESHLLEIYSASTGRFLGKASSSDLNNPWVAKAMPWFTPDGYSIWYASPNGQSEVWAITTSDGEPDPIRLELKETTVDPLYPPEGYPWGSSCGYCLEKSGWVLGPDGKHLLMLPPPWWSGNMGRMVWNEQFLVLLHSGLPEPVILELEP